MSAKIPLIIFFVAGVLLVAFSKSMAEGVGWFKKTKMNREKFPRDIIGEEVKGWHIAVIGLTWMFGAVLLWLTAK